jgi:hypothetical protein
MTTRRQPPWGISPPDPIEHNWRCPRRRIGEVVRRDATGQARVVKRCLDCHREEKP